MSPAPERTNRLDYELVGGCGSVAAGLGFVALGFALSGRGDAGDPAILTGVVSVLFSGFLVLAVAAAVRKRLARRGWPNAARGAFRAGVIAAVLNAAAWVLALLLTRARYS